MTSAPIRVERDGRWQNIDIDELTPLELSAYLETQSAAKARAWTMSIVAWINNNVVTYYDSAQVLQGNPKFCGEDSIDESLSDA